MIRTSAEWTERFRAKEMASVVLDYLERHAGKAEESSPVALDRAEGTEKKLIWRGRASDTRSDKPEENEKKINKAAEKLFKNFPPAEK